MSAIQQPAAGRLSRLPSPAAVGAAAYALAAAALLTGWVLWSDSGESGSVAGYLIMMALLAPLTAFVYGRSVPRALAADADNRPARLGTILAGIAVVSTPAFWLGLGLVLGPAAVLLGIAGRERAGAQGRGGMAIAAIALGALVVAGHLGVFVLDELSA